MMINYKIIDFLKDEIKPLDNSLDPKDLEILVRHSFDNIKSIDVEDISRDLYNIRVLKFAIRRRIQKEPISQIIGLRKFWNSNFYINETVLDPRPESELIVEKVLEYLEYYMENQYLDESKVMVLLGKDINICIAQYNLHP